MGYKHAVFGKYRCEVPLCSRQVRRQLGANVFLSTLRDVQQYIVRTFFSFLVVMGETFMLYV